MSDQPNPAGVQAGQTVYDEDGDELGVVRGFDEAGFYVKTADGGLTGVEEARDALGITYVMWRCWECGEMGRIKDDLPEACPSCEAPREELYYWAED